MKNILLKTPENCSVVPLLDAVQTSYMQSDRSLRSSEILFINSGDPYVRERDRSRPSPVVFQWEHTDPEAGKAVLLLSGSEDFSGCVRIEEHCRFVPEGPVHYGRIDVYNLIPGKDYFWKICTENGLSSAIRKFRTEGHPPRLIAIPGAVNVRDIGGWKTKHGRIRYARIYRGSAPDLFSGVTDESKRIFLEELKIRTELDLRGSSASASLPGVQRLAFPLAAYGDWGTEENGYGIFSEKQHGFLREIFDLLGEEKNFPVYCHCAGGSDRTGTLMFLLEGMLGISEKDLCAEYELTTLSCLGERSRNNSSFQGMLRILNGYAGNSLQEKILSFLGICGIGTSSLRRVRRLLEEKI